MRRLTLLLLCALVALPVMAQTTLNGAGATFPYPIYSKWFSEYHKLHPDIQMNYQSIGSGGGIRQVIAGTVDFGASDGPMTDDQLKESKIRILHMPTVLGADVPAYNVPGVTAELRFTPEALAGIFLGKIGKWNDKAITSANPGVNLPDRDIVVVHPEELVDRRVRVVRGREVDAVDTLPVFRVETEVVVGHVGGVHAGPEADRDPVVVQAGDLRLHRTGEVLAGVPARGQQVAHVRVPLGARAEIARDHAGVVDAKQLVER